MREGTCVFLRHDPCSLNGADVIKLTNKTDLNRWHFAFWKSHQATICLSVSVVTVSFNLKEWQQVIKYAASLFNLR